MTNFNWQGHTISQNNKFQPYPTVGQLQVRSMSNQHHNQKFQDLHLVDHIWIAHNIWSKRRKEVESSAFVDSLLELGLRDLHEKADNVNHSVAVSLAYSVVLTDECLELIEALGDDALHKDAVVRTVSFSV